MPSPTRKMTDTAIPRARAGRLFRQGRSPFQQLGHRQQYVGNDYTDAQGQQDGAHKVKDRQSYRQHSGRRRQSEAFPFQSCFHINLEVSAYGSRLGT